VHNRNGNLAATRSRQGVGTKTGKISGEVHASNATEEKTGDDVDERIRFWEVTIKTGILKKEKKLLSAPLDWDARKIKKVLKEVHPTWKDVSVRRLNGRPRRYSK